MPTRQPRFHELVVAIAVILSGCGDKIAAPDSPAGGQFVLLHEDHLFGKLDSADIEPGMSVQLLSYEEFHLGACRVADDGAFDLSLPIHEPLLGAVLRKITDSSVRNLFISDTSARFTEAFLYMGQRQIFMADPVHYPLLKEAGDVVGFLFYSDKELRIYGGDYNSQIEVTYDLHFRKGWNLRCVQRIDSGTVVRYHQFTNALVKMQLMLVPRGTATLPYMICQERPCIVDFLNASRDFVSLQYQEPPTR
jgi:hypothetical protein